MHDLHMNAQSEKLTHKIYMFNIGNITRQPEDIGLQFNKIKV